MDFGVLQVLQVDSDAHAEISSVDIVASVEIVDVGASTHDVGRVLVLPRVHLSNTVGVLTTHIEIC